MGSNSAELDFDSVQRGNPNWNAARRSHRPLLAAGRAQPIIAIHDVGAGGLSNAFPELVNDAGRGAIFDLKRVPWKNQACRRPRSGATNRRSATSCRSCRRTWTASTPSRAASACPYAVVGVATEERQLRVVDGEGLPGLDAIRAQGADEVRPVDVPIDVILGKPPRMTRDVKRLPGVSARWTWPAST